MNYRLKRIAEIAGVGLLTILRIVAACALAHAVISVMEWISFFSDSKIATECVALALTLYLFLVMRLRYWRVWLAMLVGIVLWFLATNAIVFTSLYYDDACGYARYAGFPLPDRRMDECSSGFSVIFDTKPGRTLVNIIFWCYTPYAVIISPRIVRWCKANFIRYKRCFIAAGAVVAVCVSIVCMFHAEISSGWYMQREWTSPYGYRRMPKEYWPKRTFLQRFMSYW